MSIEPVVGLFDDYQRAVDTIATLKDAGIQPSTISVAGLYRGYPTKDTLLGEDNALHNAITARDVLGKACGWLSTSIVVPIDLLSGALVAAGPVVTAWHNTKVHQTPGTITDALVMLNIPEFEAMVYEALISEGKVLVAIDTRGLLNEGQRVKEILQENHAISVATRIRPWYRRDSYRTG